MFSFPLCVCVCACMCVCVCVFRAAPMAYGDSQARGLIGAVATGLHHSHRNTGPELHLRLIPQLMANAGSLTH